MKRIPISEFRTHASRIIKDISETREGVVITKRGKPIAKVLPYTEEKQVMGKLEGTLVFEGDIVSPLGHEMWNACR